MLKSECEQQNQIDDHAGDQVAGRRAIDGAGNEQVADESDGVEIGREKYGVTNEAVREHGQALEH